jgi:hypothetical protein
MAKIRPLDCGKAGDTTALKAYIVANFPGAMFVDEHYGEIHYKVCCDFVVVFL